MQRDGVRRRRGFADISERVEDFSRKPGTNVPVRSAARGHEPPFEVAIQFE
jgi:hypothetical protein